MKKIIKEFKSLEKKDQLILFLLCGTIGNFFVAIVKFIFSLTIPSLWFFINAGFSLVLAISRSLIIKKYKIIRKLNDSQMKLNEENKIYLQNGVMLILLGIMYFFVSSYKLFC